MTYQPSLGDLVEAPGTAVGPHGVTRFLGGTVPMDRSALPRRQLEEAGGRAPAAFRAAELRLAPGERPTVPRRPLQVPASALVPVGSLLLGAPRPVPLLPPPSVPSIANDNAAPSRGRERIGKAVREALFLAMLAVTIAAAFYSGRQNGFQRVIVVPGPMSFYAEVS